MAADVRSFDAIGQLRLAVVKFADQCETAVDELNSEMRRMLDWLEHDRPKFWKLQVHEAGDAVHQAKIDLQKCLMYPVTTGRPSCREERAALERAEARLRYCREKSDRVKHWCREVRHELLEYQGRMTQLGTAHEVDLPHAAAMLKAILDRLETYRSTTSMPSGTAGRTGSIKRDVAEPLTDESNVEIPGANDATPTDGLVD